MEIVFLHTTIILKLVVFIRFVKIDIYLKSNYMYFIEINK